MKKPCPSGAAVMELSGKMLTSSTILASCCCYNKSRQFWWLKTTQMYYLTVLEIRKLNASKTKVSTELHSVCRVCFLVFFPQFLEVSYMVWLIALSSIFKAKHSNPVITSPLLFLTLLSYSDKDTCGYIEPTWKSKIIKILNLITFAVSFTMGTYKNKNILEYKNIFSI